jgi:hypothetical protein
MYCSAFQIDKLHGHNQSLVGTLHNKNVFHVPKRYVPTVVYRHENCCHPHSVLQNVVDKEGET